jgi:hypothetical protein
MTEDQAASIIDRAAFAISRPNPDCQCGENNNCICLAIETLCEAAEIYWADFWFDSHSPRLDSAPAAT